VLAGVQDIYSKAKFQGMNLDPGLSDIMSNPNSTWDQLLTVWKGWRDAVGPELRPLYKEFVALANVGAQDYGFASAKDFWLAGYDMPAADFVS
jgi:peptidyl-dipeptidase A